MEKKCTNGIKRPLLLAAFFGVSVVMAPQAFASWGDDEKKASHGHHASGHHGGDKAGSKWKGKSSGGSFEMAGEGFMTARLRAVWTLDLSKDQKSKIRAIQRELRSTHWELEDKIELASDKLFELYKSNGRDAKAIGKVYTEIFDYRRQKIEAAIIGGNRVEDQLTKQQLGSLKQWRPNHKWGGGWGK